MRSRRWGLYLCLCVFIAANAAVFLYRYANRTGGGLPSLPQLSEFTSMYAENDHEIVKLPDGGEKTTLRIPLASLDQGSEWVTREVVLRASRDPTSKEMFTIAFSSELHEEVVDGPKSEDSPVTLRATSNSVLGVVCDAHGEPVAPIPPLQSEKRYDLTVLGDRREQSVEESIGTTSLGDVKYYEVPPWVLPDYAVSVGDNWSKIEDVPAGAPVEIEENPAKIESRAADKVMFGGREAVLVVSSSISHMTMIGGPVPIVSYRGDHRTYIDTKTGWPLWSESKQVVTYPVDLAETVIVSRRTSDFPDLHDL